MLHRHAGWMILNTPPLGSGDNRPRLLSGSRGTLPIYNPSLRLSCLVSLWSFVTPDNVICFHLRHVYSGDWCSGYTFPQNFISLQDRKAVYESWPGKDRIHSCQKCKSNLSYQEFITKECRIECAGPMSAYSYQEQNPRLGRLYIKGLLPIVNWLPKRYLPLSFYHSGMCLTRCGFSSIRLRARRRHVKLFWVCHYTSDKGYMDHRNPWEIIDWGFRFQSIARFSLPIG